MHDYCGKSKRFETLSSGRESLDRLSRAPSTEPITALRARRPAWMTAASAFVEHALTDTFRLPVSVKVTAHRLSTPPRGPFMSSRDAATERIVCGNRSPIRCKQRSSNNCRSGVQAGPRPLMLSAAVLRCVFRSRFDCMSSSLLKWDRMRAFRRQRAIAVPWTPGTECWNKKPYLGRKRRKHVSTRVDTCHAPLTTSKAKQADTSL